MFELKNNAEIGSYLSELIEKKGYKSQRAFCTAYLKHEKRDAGDGEIAKMANRLSQIIKGSKGIQIYDLPVFTELLSVTCEEILSAGTYFVKDSNRVTNYSVAFSKDEQEWEEFVERKDKLILNPDEYGKNAIDYALEFKNYEFLKFLVKKKYIWFDSGKDNDYGITFGAGTKIESREFPKIDDYLLYMITSGDKLRKDIISLAIENKDRDILDEFRAREIPDLYGRAHYLSCMHPDISAQYDEHFVKVLSGATDEILEYFTDEFVVRDRFKYKDGSKRSHTFLFPFISELLEHLVSNKSGFAEIAIQKVTKHNNKTYELLKQKITTAIENERKRISFDDDDYLKKVQQQITEVILKQLDFYENGNIISFRDTYLPDGIITNIAHVKNSSNDTKLTDRIKKLNDSFDKIINIKKEFSV